MPSPPLQWTGILLAAGRGRRFDASGQQDKLQQKLADGKSVAQHSALHMLAALPGCEVLVILRPEHESLAAQFSGLPVSCLVCAEADAGMANSLKHALRARADSAGWLIALADMPFVQVTTITSLMQALQGGAGIAVPVYQGRRGNPVGFARSYLPQLLALDGDMGARQLLQSAAVLELEVNDPGIHQDIDVASDLAAAKLTRLL